MVAEEANLQFSSYIIASSDVAQAIHTQPHPEYSIYHIYLNAKPILSSKAFIHSSNLSFLYFYEASIPTFVMNSVFVDRSFYTVQKAFVKAIEVAN